MEEGLLTDSEALLYRGKHGVLHLVDSGSYIKQRLLIYSGAAEYSDSEGWGARAKHS